MKSRRNAVSDLDVLHQTHKKCQMFPVSGKQSLQLFFTHDTLWSFFRWGTRRELQLNSCVCVAVTKKTLLASLYRITINKNNWTTYAFPSITLTSDLFTLFKVCSSESLMPDHSISWLTPQLKKNVRYLSLDYHS